MPIHAWENIPFAFFAASPFLLQIVEKGVEMRRRWMQLLSCSRVNVVFAMISRMNALDDFAVPKTTNRFLPWWILVGLLLIVLAGGLALLLVSKTSVAGTRLVYSIEQNDLNEKVGAEQMAEPIRRRLRNLFESGVSVNAIDDTQVVILLPTQDASQLQIAKNVLANAGVLRFLIVANQFRHAPLISLAKSAPAAIIRNVIDDQGEVVGRWVTISREDVIRGATRPLRVTVSAALLRNSESGEVIGLPNEVQGVESDVQIARWMDEKSIDSIDVLMVVDPVVAVGGDDLSFAASTFDQNGGPSLAFNLTESGSDRFFALTTNNSPVGTQRNQLGIVLDDQLLSAPNILQPIRKEGRITGNFTEEEIHRMVQVLQAGQFPANLSSLPLSESAMDVDVRLIDSLLP